MAVNKQHAHRLLDELAPSQLEAVVRLLEVMVESDEEPLTEEDRRAIAASREWFEKNPEGIPFEKVVEECGLSMDAIKSHQRE